MEYFGLTDKGRVRPTNQDIFQIEAREDNQTALLVVCDGMGGANAGNVASRFAAQSFIESAGDALSGTLDETARQNLLTQALKQANETVFSLAGRQPEFRGMGTTLVGAFVQGREASILNVGDSRAYLFSADGLQQVTTDHSMVQDLLESGKITPDEAKHHPNKNIITRAIGVDSAIKIDFDQIDFSDGQVLLLCTDGLSNYVDNDEMVSAISDGQYYAYADRLVQQANKNGGGDNITVVAISN